jgi:hypothetical protein
MRERFFVEKAVEIAISYQLSALSYGLSVRDKFNLHVADHVSS